MKDKYAESFGKWFNPFDEKMGQASKAEAIQYTFEYQKSKINELLERLKECEDSLRFYANADLIEMYWGDEGHKEMWLGDNSELANSDFEENNYDATACFGKRAREYFKKYEEN